MENVIDYIPNIVLILGLIYPPLLYVLPAKYATRIDLGIKVIKTIADTLDKAKNTKGGLSPNPTQIENKTFVQKSKV